MAVDPIIPASICAAAKLWTVLSGMYESDPESSHLGVFWEPLDVLLDGTAKPHCILGNHVAFYDRRGNKLLADYVRHYDFSSSLHPQLLYLVGQWREVLSGRCEYHNGRWHMRWAVSTATYWAEKLNGSQPNHPRAG